MSRTEPHDEFLELCAVSTSGQLTEEEQKRLQEHLAVCQSCREALRQYEAVVDQAIPAIAANEESEAAKSGSSWSQEEAEKAFFKRLAQEGKAGAQEFPQRKRSSVRSPSPSPVLQWRSVASGVDALCRRNSAFPHRRILRLSR